MEEHVEVENRLVRKFLDFDSSPVLLALLWGPYALCDFSDLVYNGFQRVRAIVDRELGALNDLAEDREVDAQERGIGCGASCQFGLSRK